MKPLLQAPVDEALLDRVIAAQRQYADAYEAGSIQAISEARTALLNLCPTYFGATVEQA